jgi:hypothetical protein
MGKTLAELTLAGIAALGLFGTPYVGAQPAAVSQDLPPPQAPNQKPQIPSDNEIKLAEKEIREVYAAEYRLTDPVKKKAFADKLLTNGRESTNTAQKYVLLRDASSTLTDLLELGGAYDAIKAMNENFEGFNALETYEKNLSAAQKKIKTKEDAGKLAEAYLQLSDDASGEKNYKMALSSAKSAETIGRKAGDASLVEKASDLVKSIPDMEREYSSVKKAEDTLKLNPNDPEANMVVGKYKGFVENDWDAALKHLSRGANGICSIADQEIRLRSNGMENPEAVCLVADLWYEQSNKTSNALDKKRFATHAFELYQLAQPKATGLTKDKIAKKISELEKKVSPAKNGSTAKAGWIDLMALVDTKKSINGTWTSSGGSILSPTAVHTRLPIKYSTAPKEYDLYLTASRKTGNNALVVGLTKDGNQFDIYFDAWGGGSVSDIDLLEREKATAYKQKIFTDDNPHDIICQVRNSNVCILVDNKPIMNWEPKFDKVKIFVKVPNSLFYLGSNETSYCITKLQIVPVSNK